MPRKPKIPPVELPAIPAELLEQFGNGPMTAESINAATMALKKALIERALGGEMNHHLGYAPGAAKPAATPNQRNGKGAKTVLTEDGPIRIDVQRDREGSFEPLLIPMVSRICEPQQTLTRPKWRSPACLPASGTSASIQMLRRARFIRIAAPDRRQVVVASPHISDERDE